MNFRTPIKLIQKFAQKLLGVNNFSKYPLAYGKGALDPKQDLSGYKISADSFYTVYKNQADVYACVREYQQNMLAAGFYFLNAEDEEKDPDKGAVEYANSILNYFEPFSKLSKRMILDWCVAGNNYNHLVKNKLGTEVVGIKAFDPRTTSIVSDKHGVIHKYIQKVKFDSEAVIFDAEEVAHWKNGTDPNHEVFGMSPIEPILWEARTDIAAMLRNFFFFKNNASPDVHFILDESITGEDAIRGAAENIKNQFQGVQNSHKSAVLAGVKDIKTINISQRDMEFLGGRRFTIEKICSCYGIPKAVLNYTDSVNYSTAEIQYIKFIENTIIPAEKEFVEFFNRQIWGRIMYKGRLLSEYIKMAAVPQKTEAQGNVENRALNEYRSGALTLRQYKQKTGQELSKDDDKNPMIDQYIIHQGAGAVLLEDVGVDPFLDPNQDNAQKMIDVLSQFKNVSNEKS